MTTDLIRVKHEAANPPGDILTGLTAAGELASGMVVSDEGDVALLTDKVAQIKLAETKLPAWRTLMLSPFQLIVDAVQDVEMRCKGYRQALKEGRDGAARSVQAFRAREAQRLAREAEAERQRQVAAQKVAEEEAELVGEDAPPPVEIVERKVPNAIRGGAVMAVTSKRLTCELVDPHQCDPALLKLDNAAALAVGRAAIATGNLEVPGVYRGIKFTYTTTESFR